MAKRSSSIEPDLEKGTPSIDSTHDSSIKLVRKGTPFSRNSGHRSLFRRRGTIDSRRDSFISEQDPCESITRIRLTELLLRSQTRSQILLQARDWYYKHLQHNIKDLWVSVFRNTVAGTDLKSIEPSEKDFETLYRIILSISDQIFQTHQITLHAIVDRLLNNALLRDLNEDRNSSVKAVFMLLGFMTLLYNPRYDAKRTKELQIQKNVMDTSCMQWRIYGRTISTFSQGFDYADHPIIWLLRRFGTLIPKPILRSNLQTKIPDGFPVESIVASRMRYQTLKNVCRLEILWTSVISEHLDFDASAKRVKLFRFPSFARMMVKHKNPTLLSQLFFDNYNDSSPIGKHLPKTSSNDLCREYFTEMLITYRLIFGQDPRSWKLWTREVREIAGPNRQNILKLADADPLLCVVAGQDYRTAEAAKLYNEIDAWPAQNHYEPTSFPCFADKIIEIQRYVDHQHPHNFGALWHDHRDETLWWQFWAVLIIGGSTIVLSILSLAFQIWQAVTSQQQVWQGNRIT